MKEVCPPAVEGATVTTVVLDRTRVKRLVWDSVRWRHHFWVLVDAAPNLEKRADLSDILVGGYEGHVPNIREGHVPVVVVIQRQRVALAQRCNHHVSVQLSEPGGEPLRIDDEHVLGVHGTGNLDGATNHGAVDCPLGSVSYPPGGAEELGGRSVEVDRFVDRAVEGAAFPEVLLDCGPWLDPSVTQPYGDVVIVEEEFSSRDDRCRVSGIQRPESPSISMNS